MSTPKIDIGFVAGLERYPFFQDATLRFIERSGLKQRFAIIQDTCLDGCPDMYFDEALWRRLIEFIKETVPEASISIVDDYCNPEANGVPLRDYLTSWSKLDETERCPPAFVMAKRDGE